MSWVGIVVVTGLVVFGWFAYKKLKAMEADILHDIARKNADPPQTLSEVKSAPPVPPREPDVAEPLAGQLLALISARPGLMQTQIYQEFAGINKKQLQQTLLEMDRNGRIRREKARGSYELYPG